MGNDEVASQRNGLVDNVFRYIDAQKCARCFASGIARLQAGVIEIFLQGRRSKLFDYLKNVFYAHNFRFFGGWYCKCTR